MDDIEKHFKMLDDLVIYHVNKTQDFFTWLKQDLDNGDKITNIINLIEDIRKYRETNLMWCAIIRHWVLFHYCNRDEALNFQRAYNDWKIDNKSGITAENAVENQKTLLQALLKVGSLKSTDLPMILSAQKKKDVIYNTKRKSTEILELNINEIQYEKLSSESVKSGNVLRQNKTFPEYFIQDNETLAEICKSIFNKNDSPKDYAIMLCLLSENGLITIANRKRKSFFSAWYNFINKQLPKRENFNAINKFIIDKAGSGFVFKDEEDPDYCNQKLLLDKALKKDKN